MTEARLDPGSFRDSAGNVYDVGGRILRTVNECARADYEAVRDSGTIAVSIASGYLIASDEVALSESPDTFQQAAYVLEHARIPYISYPYEWSFSQLKAAALHHLDFQLDLLERGVSLSDATAYNVQFVGSKPVFIDLLSLRQYSEGDFWLGHRQFCEQFLNPLLLRALIGIPHNAWYRGAVEGIPTIDLARILPLRKRFSWNVLSQVTLQAKLERDALNNPESAISKAQSKKTFTKMAYRGFLSQLRNWIAKLQPADSERTVWGEYARTHTYSDDEVVAKRRFIANFAADVKPEILFDLGCNTGDYSLAALEGGAEYVVGFDFDQRAIDLAYSRSVEGNLPFLPLWFDAANPSPDQGWRQAERQGFHHRAKADALIALAFEHHLAIAKNVPMAQVLDWLVGVAPQGVIEFVPKTDSTIVKMLALREDIFTDYSERRFVELLEERANIICSERISESGRILFRYARQ